MESPSSANPSLERVLSRSLREDFGKSLGAAPSPPPRPLLPLALDLIKDFEGWSATAYDDPAGYCTIGYGHLISLRPCGNTDLGDFARPLTEAQGALLLQNDTTTSRLSIQSLVLVDLNDEQFGALTSFVFNIGKRNFAGSTMLRLLNAGEYELAAAQIRRWVRAGGQVLNGLIDRRACELTLFRGHLTYNTGGRFDRRSCIGLGAAPDAGSEIDIDLGE